MDWRSNSKEMQRQDFDLRLAPCFIQSFSVVLSGLFLLFKFLIYIYIYIYIFSSFSLGIKGLRRCNFSNSRDDDKILCTIGVEIEC
jgi:hypothetical protein